eukprot:COSAG03_NODE_177_length_11096_cov_1567.562062_6_plen_94_part_00
MDPRYNSHEAFAEWFDRNIRSLEDVESAGEDWTEGLMEWCEFNNHEYREDGVYNMNIAHDSPLPADGPPPGPQPGSIEFLLFGGAAQEDEDQA